MPLCLSNKPLAAFVFLLLTFTICHVASPQPTDQSPASSLRSSRADDSREIDQVRCKLETEPFKGRWQLLLQTADAMQTPGFKMQGHMESRVSLGKIGINSFAYALTGEERFGNFAKQEVWKLLEMEQWHTQYHWNKGAELVSSEHSLACALFYRWARDLMDADERLYFIDRSTKLGLEPYLESVEKYHDWWVDNPISNWRGVCHGGNGLLALELAETSVKATRAYAYALQNIPEFLGTVIGENGSGHEGVMYWRYGVEYAMMFLTTAMQTRTEHPLAPGTACADVFKLINDRNTGFWDIAMQAPDGAYANFNDMNELTFKGLYAKDLSNHEGGPNSELAAVFERISAGWDSNAPGNPLLQWAADNGGGPYYFQGTSPFWFIWRRDYPSHVQKPRPATGDSLLFKTGGYTVWKTPALWTYLKAGWNCSKSHNNLDLGSFILGIGSERFICDPGYGKKQTSQHSALTLNDREQQLDAWATYLDWENIPETGIRKASIDLTAAYEHQVRSYTREFILMGVNQLLILDHIYPIEAGTLTLTFPTRFPATIQGHHVTITGTKHALQITNLSNTPTPVASANWSVDQEEEVTYLRLSFPATATETTMLTSLTAVPANHN